MKWNPRENYSPYYGFHIVEWIGISNEMGKVKRRNAIPYIWKGTNYYIGYGLWQAGYDGGDYVEVLWLV